RTGTFFSFEEAGIVPDIVCLSKSISGSGLPMALTLFRPELDIWSPGEHNGTFRGNNPAFVTATAALREFWADPAFQSRLADTIESLQSRISAIALSTSGGGIRGRGLLTGIVFDDPDAASKIAAEAFRNGLLVETSGPQDEVVKLMPPLTITAEELERGLDILEAAVRTVTGPAVKTAAEAPAA